MSNQQTKGPAVAAAGPGNAFLTTHADYFTDESWVQQCRYGLAATPPRRGRKPRRESPRSELKCFCRVSQAISYADVVPAIIDLTGRLLHRGQDPQGIANDIAFLARRGGFNAMVAVIVNDMALQARRSA